VITGRSGTNGIADAVWIEFVESADWLGFSLPRFKKAPL
jgi:hypothetical protein